MSSSSPPQSHQTRAPSQAAPIQFSPGQAPGEQNSTGSNRRSSFFGSFLSNISSIGPRAESPSDVPPFSASLASSAGSSKLGPFSPGPFENTSPISSVDSVFRDCEDSRVNRTPFDLPGHPHSHQRSMSSSPQAFWPHSESADERRASLSHGWNGFRWPVSRLSSQSSSPVASHSHSQTQPIPIPESSSAPDRHLPPLEAASLPNRRASVGPAFRRAFELPSYTSLYEDQESPTPIASHRGRSGSMLSSLGFPDILKDSSPPTHSGARLHRPRKLSPMGERMVRDHPF